MKMKTNKLLSSLIAVFAGIVLFAPSHALAAAYGVSPPWIENENIKPGSNFVYVINLSSNDLPSNMKVKTQLEGDPEIMEWLNVENKDKLALTTGQSMVPMSVNVSVPKDAKTGKYHGTLRTTLEAEESGHENVAVLLGGNIRIDLTVVDHDVTDYWVQNITVEPMTEGQSINLKMSLKNLGNVEVEAVQTKLAVIDMKTGEELLNGTIEKLNVPVYPQTMSNATLSLPAPSLMAGNYWVDVEAFKGGESVYQARQNLAVKPVTANGSITTGVNVADANGKVRPAATEKKTQSASVPTSVRVKAPLTNQLIGVIIVMLLVLTGIVAKIYLVIKKKRR